MKSCRISLSVGLLCAALSLGWAASAQQPATRRTNLDALVDAERAFARAAATKGTRDAFLEFLADDGIIFQPGPINGKEFWRQRQPRKGLLSWQPVYADVSAAGDLGYTTGPFEFRPSGPDDKPTAFGQYFTIWRRQSGGSWKAVLDRGISHPAPTMPMPLLKYAADVSLRNRSGSIGRDAILKAESKFADLAAHDGWRRAAAAYFAADVRALRDNSFPAVGKAAASAIAYPDASVFSWRPAIAVISASDDLGYSYGTYEFKSPSRAEKGIYVRMWKRQSDKSLKVVIDIQVANPSE